MGDTDRNLYPSATNPKTPFSYATGVNYNRHATASSGGTSQITKAEAEHDLPQISKIAKMIRVFAFNENVMDEAKKLNLEVALGTENSYVTKFANDPSSCRTYVADNIQPYSDIIKIVSVGNEVFNKTGFAASTVSAAIKNLKSAMGTDLKIPVTTDCIWANVGHGSGPSWAPSTGALTPNGEEILTTLQKLYGSDAYLLASFYPYWDVKGWENTPGLAKKLLPYALFQDASLGPVANQFDSDYETLRIAMKNAKLEDVTVLVSENGWATEDNKFASVPNLNTYINGYHNWQQSEGISLTTFVFEMYDEPGKPGDEGTFGLYTSESALKDGLTLPDWTTPIGS